MSSAPPSRYSLHRRSGFLHPQGGAVDLEYLHSEPLSPPPPPPPPPPGRNRYSPSRKVSRSATGFSSPPDEQQQLMMQIPGPTAISANLSGDSDGADGADGGFEPSTSWNSDPVTDSRSMDTEDDDRIHANTNNADDGGNGFRIISLASSSNRHTLVGGFAHPMPPVALPSSTPIVLVPQPLRLPPPNHNLHQQQPPPQLQPNLMLLNMPDPMVGQATRLSPNSRSGFHNHQQNIIARSSATASSSSSQRQHHPLQVSPSNNSEKPMQPPSSNKHSPIKSVLNFSNSGAGSPIKLRQQQQPLQQRDTSNSPRKHSSSSSNGSVSAKKNQQQPRDKSASPRKQPNKQSQTRDQQPSPPKTARLRARSKTPERRLRVRSKTPERRSQQQQQPARKDQNSTDNSTSGNKQKKGGLFGRIFRGNKSKKPQQQPPMSSNPSKTKAMAPSGTVVSKQQQYMVDDLVEIFSDTGSDTETLRHTNSDLLHQQQHRHSIPSAAISSTPVLVGDYTSPNGNLRTVEEDRPEVFYSDEVSVLTNPTLDERSHGNSTHPGLPRIGTHGSGGSHSSGLMRLRKDPSEGTDHSTDPMGKYWSPDEAVVDKQNNMVEDDKTRKTKALVKPSIDPFDKPVFAEPDGRSPAVQNRPQSSGTGYTMKPSPRRKISPLDRKVLRVEVVSPKVVSPRIPFYHTHRTKDPSPHSSSNLPSPPTVQGDPQHHNIEPVGASPLHKHERGPYEVRDGSPQALDPPLFLEALEQSSSSSSSESNNRPDSLPRLVIGDGYCMPSSSSLDSSSSAEVRKSLLPSTTLNNTTKATKLLTSKRKLLANPRKVLSSLSPKSRRSGGGVRDETSSFASKKPVILSRYRPVIDNPMSKTKVSLGSSPALPPPPAPPFSSTDNAENFSSQPKTKTTLKAQLSSRINKREQPKSNSSVTQKEEAMNMEIVREETTIKKTQSLVVHTDPTPRLFRKIATRPSSTRSSSVREQIPSPSPTDPRFPLKKMLSKGTMESGNSHQDLEIHLVPTPRRGLRNIPPLSNATKKAEQIVMQRKKRMSQGAETVQETAATAVVPSRPPPSPSSGLSYLQNARRKLDPLHVDTSGNNSAGSSLEDDDYKENPVDFEKHLTVPKAAKINAKAVAYLQAIQRDPETRKQWQLTECSVPSPVMVGLFSSQTPSITATSPKPSLSTTFNDESGSSRLFHSYSKGKFNGRRLQPAKVSDQRPVVLRAVDADSVGKNSVDDSKNDIRPSYTGVSSLTMDHESAIFHSKLSTCINRKVGIPTIISKEGKLNRNVTLSGFAVSKGLELFREKREHDIAIGRSHRVVHEKKIKATKQAHSSLYIEDDENDRYLDPIQRTGRRILSRAAIPIQANMRRFLAQKEAVDRLWALLEIQSYMRRWRAEASFIACFLSAVTIQTIFRGFRARTWHRVRTKSAVLVQKVIRGHLASVRTYDRVFGIILVQAQARGWVTRFRIRRHLAQLRCEAQQKGALRLQTWWRANFSRMLYEFLVSDTVVAQNSIRLFLAKRKAARLREIRDTNSAIKIQAAWRGFQKYTDFIFLLIDIMTLQRSVRCWMARRTLLDLKRKKATTLFQARWRGYVVYTKYARYRSATTIQSQWRCFSAHQKYKRYCAAVTIQKEWRCLQAYRDYTFYRAAKMVQAQWRCFDARRKYMHDRASTIIQKHWRCFHVYAEYIYTLADIIQVQSIARVWLTKRMYGSMRRERAATTIQSEWRRGAAHLSHTRYTGARKFQSAWRRYTAYTAFNQYLAARNIQTAWRRYSLNAAFTQFLAARKLQTTWRKCTTRSAYVSYISCRRIQTTWRRYSSRLAFIQFTASKKIQASLRRFIARTAYTAYISSRKIQTAWRRYSMRTAYTHYISTRRIQTAWRRYSAHWSYIDYVSMRKIQTAWRRYALRSAYIHYISARSIQAAWRRYTNRSAYVVHISSRRIQTAWRRHALRSAFVDYRAATRIQTIWRKAVAYTAYIDYKAARDIQACYRMHCDYKRYAEFRAARKIQAIWRGHTAYADYMRYCTVTKIQTAWRRYSVLTVYSQFRAAMKIQAAWRRRSAFSNYVKYCSARKIQAAWRGFHSSADFILALADIIRVQSAVRSLLSKRQLHGRKRANAAVVIQTEWRMHHDVKNFREYKAALYIQKTWRMRSAVKDFFQYKAARIIQAAWRMHSIYTDYVQYKAATMVQKYWRRRCTYKHVLEFKASACIQKEWRRWRALAEYSLSLMNIIIAQTVARSYLAKKKLHMLRQTTLMEVSAAVIQKYVRRHLVEVQVQTDLVSIILAQSILRRYLARKSAERKQYESKLEAAAISVQAALRRSLALRLANKIRTMNKFEESVILVQSVARRLNARILALQRRKQIRNQAATKLQSIWRGFWKFSHYVILQYEVVRMQAMARGKLYRKDFNLKLGCCIMIQAAVRKFLVQKQFRELRIPQALAMAKAFALREVLACVRIQFWWRIVMDCCREKEAALKIERFVVKQLKSKETEKSIQKALSENSDLFAFSSDSNNSDVFDFSKSPGLLETKSYTKPHGKCNHSVTPDFPHLPSVRSPRAKSPASRHSYSDHKSHGFGGHRASSPDMRMVMRHDRDSPSSKPRRSPSKHAAAEPDVASSLRRAKEVMNRTRISDVADEAFLDAVASGATNSTRSRKTPSITSRDHDHHPISANLSRRSSGGKMQVERFFADDLESEVSAVLEQAVSTNRSAKSSLSRASLYHSERSHYSYDDRGYEVRSPVFAHSSMGHGFELTAALSPISTHSRGGVTPHSITSKSRSRHSEGEGTSSLLCSPKKPPPKSPRHGTILMMNNPYPEYSRQRNTANYEEYIGEEFGEV